MKLLGQWQKGRVSAFETLFLRYKDLVIRTAWSMVGERSEAEDILQMVFIKVYEHREKFKGDEIGFRRWLHRITINLSIDILRKKRSCLYLDELKEKGFEPVYNVSDSRLEVGEELWQTLDSLDDKQRSVVVFRYLHELSYEEIAKTLGIPLGTVKSRLNTAMKTMRKKLVDEYEL
jgi:RNA polymerase sigma-70 factor (ECF subfamily)